jgi:hypothetical protein
LLTLAVFGATLCSPKAAAQSRLGVQDHNAAPPAHEIADRKTKISALPPKADIRHYVVSSSERLFEALLKQTG